MYYYSSICTRSSDVLSLVYRAIRHLQHTALNSPLLQPVGTQYIQETTKYW
jgi:hypothetical protein